MERYPLNNVPNGFALIPRSLVHPADDYQLHWSSSIILYYMNNACLPSDVVGLDHRVSGVAELDATDPGWRKSFPNIPSFFLSCPVLSRWAALHGRRVLPGFGAPKTRVRWSHFFHSHATFIASIVSHTGALNERFCYSGRRYAPRRTKPADHGKLFHMFTW
jgi:hypothetical protein